MGYTWGMQYEKRSSDDERAWPLTRTWWDWLTANWVELGVYTCMLTGLSLLTYLLVTA